MQAKWNKEFLHHFSWAGRCSAVSMRAELLQFPLFPPSFIYRAWHHMLWDTPWIIWDHLSQLCPVPGLCTPSLHAGGLGRDAGKALALGEHCPAITKTSLYFQHCVQNKSNTQLHTSFCEKNYLYSRQNQHRMIDVLISRPLCQGCMQIPEKYCFSCYENCSLI